MEIYLFTCIGSGFMIFVAHIYAAFCHIHRSIMPMSIQLSMSMYVQLNILMWITLSIRLRHVIALCCEKLSLCVRNRYIRLCDHCHLYGTNEIVI